MNNPNPFLPQGSLLDQQNKRRTHMKYGVFCVLTVSVAGLMIMLIQGCKQKTDTNDTSMPQPDTNVSGSVDTNVPSAENTNLPPMTPPTNATGLNPNLPPGAPINTVQTQPVPPQVQQQPLPPVNPVVTPAMTTPTPPDTGAGEYKVVKGDSLAKIAKKSGVTLKALEAANPGVNSNKLKINQKLVIPAGGKTAADASAAPVGTAPSPEAATTTTYTVKSGDTLTKIAKAHHVKLKALQAANGFKTTKIKVGDKIKIPGKAEAAAPATTAVQPPTDTPPMAPVLTQPVNPAPPAPSVTNPPGVH